jgi:hypothetical protein
MRCAASGVKAYDATAREDMPSAERGLARSCARTTPRGTTPAGSTRSGRSSSQLP